MISANLAQNRLRLIHDVDLYMRLYGIYVITDPGFIYVIIDRPGVSACPGG